MSSLLTADWNPVGKDGIFRKFEVYPMGWASEFNIDNVVISSTPFGGPFAVCRNRQKLVKVQGSGRPVINIYSAAGYQISSVLCRKPPIYVGWSNKEDLLCIEEDGSVLMYDMFGNDKHMFSMNPPNQEIRDTKVIEAKTFVSGSGTGIAVLTSAFRFFFANTLKDAKVRSISDIPGLASPPSCWAVISEDRNTRIIVARERELFICSQAESHDVVPEFSVRMCTVIEMAVSLDCRQIALFTDVGRLWIGSSDLLTKYCEVDTKRQEKPSQLAWCGLEGVVAHWDGVLLLVTRNGDTSEYPCSSTVHLSPEIDCVRVVSSYSHEILQSVPQVVQEILRISSNDPGLYLLEASRHFQRRSHRADEYIRLLLKKDLRSAVDKCIEAAGYEFVPDTQKMLIRAAQFGKGFLPGMNSENYVYMCRILRVLNAVRNVKVSIPLTYVQLMKIDISGLLERLMRRKNFYMAVEICKHLKIPPAKGSSRILEEWAFYKVDEAKQGREEVAREIAEKLAKAPGISYKKIALRANNSGHSQLAIRLMDYEPRAREQVPLLLDLGQETRALEKAIDSGDTNLVYTVLLKMRGKSPVGDFVLKIRKYPLAYALYTKYCRQHQLEKLHDIYSQFDEHDSQAACHLREAYNPANSTSVASMATAQECYKKARNDFMASMCEDQLKLFKRQTALENKYTREFTGTSLHDTLQLLLSMNEVKVADNMRLEFKVPDRRYWWLRIMALATRGEWSALEKFSKEKRPPIGYEPFIDVCLEYNKVDEAKKYISRVRDDLKVKYYLKLGMLSEAAQSAFDHKDKQALLLLQTKCGADDRSTAERINIFLAQLSRVK